MAKYNRYEQAIDVCHVNKKHQPYVYDPYISLVSYSGEKVVPWQQQQIQHCVVDGVSIYAGRFVHVGCVRACEKKPTHVKKMNGTICWW